MNDPGDEDFDFEDHVMRTFGSWGAFMDHQQEVEAALDLAEQRAAAELRYRILEHLDGLEADQRIGARTVARSLGIGDVAAAETLFSMACLERTISGRLGPPARRGSTPTWLYGPIGSSQVISG